MDEFSFIRSIRQKTYKQSAVVQGIGDDAAVFRQAYQDIVTAVDTFVEGVHFTKQTMAPIHIGYKAVAANLSDMAAMGATPAFYLVSMVIPKSWASHEIEDIYQGMKELANFYKMDLLGGDTVSGSELTLSVTIIGYTDKNKARYRRLARSGDIIFVTGNLGDSQAGLHILNHPGTYREAAYFINRHQLPTARVAFANALQPIARVALNDISDGIANEAAEIAEASNVVFHLFEKDIPVHPSLTQFSARLQRQWVYFGGEDFELIGTVPACDWPKVVDAAARTNTKVTKIGYVSFDKLQNGTVFLHHENGQVEILHKEGYIHLK